MANIIIDTDKWTTQQDKASKWIKADGSTGVSIQYISKLINKRKLKALRLDEIGIVLVER